MPLIAAEEMEFNNGRLSVSAVLLEVTTFVIITARPPADNKDHTKFTENKRKLCYEIAGLKSDITM
jgi:hypothetical protein